MNSKEGEVIASLIFDISLTLITIFLVIVYAKKGITKTMLDFIKVILAVFLTYSLRITIGKIIDKFFMRNRIISFVRNSLLSTINGEDKGIDFVAMYEDVPQFYRSILTKFGLDLQSFEENMSNIHNIGEEQINQLSENIGSSLSMMLSIILAVILLFTIFMIILTLIVNLLNLLTKFKTVGFFNGLLGAVFGFVVGVVVICIIISVTNFLIKYLYTVNPNVFNESITEKSILFRWFEELNPIEKTINFIKNIN